MPKTLAYIMEEEHTWVPRLVEAMGPVIKSMDGEIVADDADGALELIKQRYGGRLESHELMEAHHGDRTVPAIVVVIKDAA